ncbi:hypothetical protein DRN74_02405 [Candidatus Micrarchaeota archaeon]|nr:MAG: hypothetical protein DRN74_02405 [Candidatus Micrarchaeota archaeon]
MARRRLQRYYEEFRDKKIGSFKQELEKEGLSKAEIERIIGRLSEILPEERKNISDKARTIMDEWQRGLEVSKSYRKDIKKIKKS